MVLPTPLQAFSGMPKAAATTEKQTIVDGEKMTGAEALVRSLEDLGVKDVFGVPGGAILPVYDAINDKTGFRFVLMRHEQAAGHAAEGYAVSTGQVGVCIVTSGPGATNMITPIADANMDSVPMVVITGQVGVNAIGTDAFQEADIVGATYPVVKHSYLVTRAQDIPRVLAEAHYVARSGRPGPVVVDVTKTAQTGDMYYSWPQRMILPGYNPTTKAHGRVLSDAAKLFEQSYRPVLYGAAVRHVPMPASSCRNWRKSRTLRLSLRCPHAVLCLIPIRRCSACLACMARLPLPAPCSVAICLLRSALVSTIVDRQA